MRDAFFLYIFVHSPCFHVIILLHIMFSNNVCHATSHVSVYTFVLITGAGELQQGENGFAVSSKDHGEPNRSRLEPREYIHGCINNVPSADAYNPPPQEQ